MNQEIKQKLEQAAIKSADRDQVMYYPARASYFDGFTAAAQTILENPGEWGLVPKAQHDHYMAKYTSLVEWYDKLMGTPCEQVRHRQEIESMQSQLTKYREALERIANTYSGSPDTDGLIEIADEALKQEVNND